MTAPPSPDCVEQVLQPLALEDLVRQYWGRKFIHIPGPKSKFETLFSWNQLNLALEQIPFQPHRLMLYKEGRQIEPDAFCEYRFCVGGRRRYLKSTNLTKELRKGATLILNQVEELSRPLQEFMTGLDRIFRANMHVNLYAGFGSENGFLLHWDNHDTLILQVAGKKKWLVYEPTRQNPLREEKQAVPEPTGRPIWEGYIEEGGLFHIPRGWWHVAYPVVEQPSLHLTVGIKSLMGIDLLRWHVNRCIDKPVVRTNLPLWESRAVQQDYVESLRREVLNEWDSDLILKLLIEADASAPGRTILQLPNATVSAESRISPRARIRLFSMRHFFFSTDSQDGSATFQSADRTWRCNPSLVPALYLLNDGRSHTLRELFGALADQRFESETMRIVADLTEAGVLAMEID